jgi:DUF4097 and DUF4098 domain-containing protein YvlB
MLSVALLPMVVSAQSRRNTRSWSDDDNGPKETERVDRTIAFPSNGTLRLKNFSGDIHIVGTRGRDVVLKATRRAGREQLDHIKLDVTTSGSTVTINANKQDDEWERDRHNNNVVETTFDLEVPATARLDVDAFSSDVTIEGIDGDQQLKTFSGEIRLRDARGEIEAETFSGDIVMTAEPNARGSVSFSSFSGDLDTGVSIQSTSWRKRSVEGSLPGGPGRRLKFKTFSGDVQIKTR